jgi:hypothetical protein
VKYGPYSYSALKALVAKLDELGVTYSVSEDRERLDRLREELKDRAPSRHPTVEPEPDFLTIEIGEDEVAANADALTDFGISVVADEPDFTPSYYCKKCGWRSQQPEPGICSKHGCLLVDEEEYRRGEEEGDKKLRRFLGYGAIAAGLVLLIVRLLLIK